MFACLRQLTSREVRAAWLLPVLSVALLAVALLVHVPQTDAVVSGTPCAGNVCTGSVTVGGQSVQYSYTQHLRSAGDLRVRLNGGVYNTAGVVAFQLSGLPAFSSFSDTANPTNGAQALPESETNPTFTSYEVRDSDGCPSCIYDHVMRIGYTALTAGSYTFTITIYQNGSVGGVVALPFYVDAGAPLNNNENTTWAALTLTNPCGDAVDNDLDFLTDCADNAAGQCLGVTTASGKVCQAPETTCNDEFDNDSDGFPDCLDSSCNGLPGNPYGAGNCQYQSEYGPASCTGTYFDNDGDGLTNCADNVSGDGNPAHICWKTAGSCPLTESSCNDGVDNDSDISYGSTYDDDPLTGLDCLDYDCAGSAFCPNKENYTVAGVNDDTKCFDSLDNDLDGDFNCADSDCAGAVNPSNPNQACYTSEFDLGQRFQYCANGFDDDGNGNADCSDASCKQQFGNCGPCPSREDYAWNSCADGSDNDSDLTGDCSDANCAGRVGSTTRGAMCGTESTDAMCGDGFDNDVDGLIDCADSGCNGSKNGAGSLLTCQPAGETSCSDGFDNDADGLVDCVDSSCAGVSSCAPNSWTQVASCQTVPRYSGATAFTSDNPTVTAIVRQATYVSSIDTIRLQGTASYSSVTFVIGDNTTASSYYPHALSGGSGCTLTDTSAGTAAANFSMTIINGHAVQIFNKLGVSPGVFDITLTCPTAAVPTATSYYPISLSALKAPSNYPEYGDVSFSTILYENVRPTVGTIEGEGASGGNMSMPYSTIGASRRFRAVPTDPAPYATGICNCFFSAGGVGKSSNSTCVSSPVTFTQDVVGFQVNARAEDGAGNATLGKCQNGTTNCAKDDDCSALPGTALCSGSPNTTFNVNVTPSMTTTMSLAPSSPYFSATSAYSAFFTTEFTTGVTDNFTLSTCDAYIYDSSGNLASGGPLGPSFSFAGTKPATNVITCNGAWTAGAIANASLPSLADGKYTVKIKARDNDGDTGESNSRTLYVCNSVPSYGSAEPSVGGAGDGCQFADFDNDSASEGLFTTKYSTAAKACDNCVNLPNAAQTDVDADGVGDVCSVEDYGRCEVDTDIVCLYDSDQAPECTGASPDALCCPGPSIKDHPIDGVPINPQKCERVWGLCTLGGEVCFVDEQCPGGKGVCQGDSAVACYKDADCVGTPGTPACIGADRCENLIFPWIETKYGNVFSQKKITQQDQPPQNLYNATYCVTAKETIFNFNSEEQNSCTVATDASARPTLPKSSNQYTSVKGRLDIAGLRSGKFGTVVTVSPASQLDAVIASSYANALGGRVYRVVGDATISAHVLQNDLLKGQGTIFIDGGNLTIAGDITYSSGTVTDLKKLASLGWIVIDDGSGTKGNVYVDKSVETVVGAFYTNGSSGFWSVAPPDIDSEVQLTVYGLVIAKEFHLSRSFKSLTEGAERFIYDGRAVVNPPPGFTDVTKALPSFTDTPTQ